MRKTTVFLSILLCTMVFAGTARAQENNQATAQGPATAEEQEAAKTFNQFLEQWLVKQDIDAALKFIQPTEDDLVHYRMFFGSMNADINTDFGTWIRKVLCMWLFASHGDISSLGHGNPGDPGYASLPTSPDEIPNRAHWQTVDEAVKVLELETLSDDPGTVVATIKLANAQHDLIVAALSKNEKGDWKIRVFYWVI